MSGTVSLTLIQALLALLLEVPYVRSVERNGHSTQLASGEVLGVGHSSMLDNYQGHGHRSFQKSKTRGCKCHVDPDCEEEEVGGLGEVKTCVKKSNGRHANGNKDKYAGKCTDSKGNRVKLAEQTGCPFLYEHCKCFKSGKCRCPGCRWVEKSSKEERSLKDAAKKRDPSYKPPHNWRQCIGESNAFTSYKMQILDLRETEREEAEKKKREEEEKAAKEAEAEREREEEEKRMQEAADQEAQQKAEEERRRKEEEEAQRKLAEEAEAEKKRLEEEARKAKEEEARKIREAEEARKKAEEEEKKRLAEQRAKEQAAMDKLIKLRDNIVSKNRESDLKKKAQLDKLKEAIDENKDRLKDIVGWTPSKDQFVWDTHPGMWESLFRSKHLAQTVFDEHRCRDRCDCQACDDNHQKSCAEDSDCELDSESFCVLAKVKCSDFTCPKDRSPIEDEDKECLGSTCNYVCCNENSPEGYVEAPKQNGSTESSLIEQLTVLAREHLLNTERLANTSKALHASFRQDAVKSSSSHTKAKTTVFAEDVIAVERLLSVAEASIATRDASAVTKHSRDEGDVLSATNTATPSEGFLHKA